ncbi:MAG TPA: hypothetical protein VNE61_05050 [Ktedonobacteraceae bacterium]|nr:hypothetical protein [Ktedonobacteraceae bacterium]
MASTSSRNKATPSTSLLRIIAAITLLLLAAQFLIGMTVNLFVVVPSAHPGAYPSNYFVGVVQGVIWALGHGPQWLLFHVIVGLLLFLGSLILIVLAIAARRRAWIITTILGLIGIMGAGFNGASFMNFGGQGFSSMLMAVGFLLAAISYAVGFYVTR